MKRIYIGTVILAFIICLSCDEKFIIVKCPDCIETEPVETKLEVKLDDSFHGVNLTSEVRIYEGNIEDSVLLGTYTINYSKFQPDVKVNNKYTLSATYTINNKTYIAIDSATPRVRYEAHQCDNPCYYVYDKTINLKLKYTK